MVNWCKIIRFGEYDVLVCKGFNPKEKNKPYIVSITVKFVEQFDVMKTEAYPDIFSRDLRYRNINSIDISEFMREGDKVLAQKMKGMLKH